MKAPKEAMNDELIAPTSTYLRPFTLLRSLTIGRFMLSLSLTYLQKEEQETSLYNRLSALCVERGLSRQQLADVLGVSPSTVLYIERGEYNPSLELSLRISRLFELPIEEIFTEVNYEQS
jgi:DNA-binding XRE family transcriptional regulator